jgi:hypothetical protein
MDKQQQALNLFELWFKSLKVVKTNNGPAIGTMATTLVLLERLKSNFDLNFDSHIAEGGAQIKGASGTKVAAILKSFGETRPFAKEGGRTNRGGQGDIRPLFNELAKLNLDQLSAEERNSILVSFQSYLVEKVRDYITTTAKKSCYFLTQSSPLGSPLSNCWQKQKEKAKPDTLLNI